MKPYKRYYTRQEHRDRIIAFLKRNEKVTMQDVEMSIRPFVFDYKYGLKRFVERLTAPMIKSKQIIVRRKIVSINVVKID